MWFLHLVGDVHQPLHSLNRVSSTAPEGDNGGNGERVCPIPPTPCREKLHHYWDRALDPDDSANDLAKALAVGPTLPDADSTSAHNLVTSAWIDESFADANSGVCVSPIEEGNGPFELTAAYRNAAKQEARKRIALAGARLANVLNGGVEAVSL